MLKAAGSCTIRACGSAVVDWRSGAWTIRSARSRLWSLLGIEVSREFHSFSGEGGRQRLEVGKGHFGGEGSLVLLAEGVK